MTHEYTSLSARLTALVRRLRKLRERALRAERQEVVEAIDGHIVWVDGMLLGGVEFELDKCIDVETYCARINVALPKIGAGEPTDADVCMRLAQQDLAVAERVHDNASIVTLRWLIYTLNNGHQAIASRETWKYLQRVERSVIEATRRKLLDERRRIARLQPDRTRVCVAVVAEPK